MSVKTVLWLIKIVQLAADAALVLVLVLSIEPGQKLLAFTIATVITLGGSFALDTMQRALPAAHALVAPMKRMLSGLYHPVISLVLGVAVLVMMYVPLGLPAAAIVISAWVFVIYEATADTLTAIFVK